MKAAILLTLTLLTSAAFADAYPYPDPGGGTTTPGTGPAVCNMDYSGGFQRGGGPLTMSLRSVGDGTNAVNVTVYYQNQTLFGYGVCDDRGIDFTIPNDYRHIGSFEIGNRGWRINGTLFHNGYREDRFLVYQY